MLTTRKEIIAKINDLPVDYANHVYIGKGGTAAVKSFSGPGTHTVRIERWETDDQLKVDCTCRATRLCRHITAFYAVAKEPNMLIQEESIEMPTEQMSFNF